MRSLLAMPLQVVAAATAGAQFHVYFYTLTFTSRLVQESHRS